MSSNFTAYATGGQVITYLNNGTGSLRAQYNPFELAPTFQGAPVSLGVTLGDGDGDGDLDIITAEGYTRRVVMGRDGLAPPVPAPTITGVSPGAGPVGTSCMVPE